MKNEYSGCGVVKILMLGDSAVGKTSLFLRITEEPDRSTTSYVSTIGIDFRTKDYLFENHKVRMKIWDTAGQERFVSITKNYFCQSRGVALVYDIGNKKTFSNITRWIKLLRETNKLDDLVMILIGNKTDLKSEEREVSTAEGEIFAYENNCLFIECSALNNVNVTDAFDLLFRAVLKKNPQYLSDEPTQTKVVQLRDKKSLYANCCHKSG